MSKKNVGFIPSIIFYFLAVLLVIYAIWAYTYCANIISNAVESGQLTTTGNEFDIASFYMSNSGQYFILAFLLAAAGLILHRKQSSLNEPTVVGNANEKKTNDEELDEWFNEERS